MADGSNIYQAIAPIPVNMPNLADNASKALSLSQMNMQNQNMQLHIQQQQAMRAAYAKNTGPDGNLDQAGFMSDIGKAAPQMALDLGEKFNKMNKDSAEATIAHLNAVQQIHDTAMPYMQYVDKAAPDQKPQVFSEAMKQLEARIGPENMKNIPQDSSGNYIYDPGDFKQKIGQMRETPQYLERLKSQAGIANTNSGTQKNYAEARKIISETGIRAPLNPNDPASLVPYNVPKDHQSAAFKEIDSAENTKKMASSIMSSFEDAVKDTQGVGTVTSYLKTPRSAQALHQALQPTFKDLEGTVRQAAMDNTFKNITPTGVDTENDINTKRQALQDYLQSKMSAPISRSYGINLIKFPSTSPLSSTSKKVSNDSGGVIPNANAAQGGSPVGVPSGQIVMNFPDGQTKLVPVEQKGRWIKAGGNVVR